MLFSLGANTTFSLSAAPLRNLAVTSPDWVPKKERAAQVCYAKPGPRCSSHVKTELSAAQEEWQHHPSDKTLHTLRRKELEYDTTPGGQAELLAQIDQGLDKDGTLSARLAQGVAKRAKALEEMKKGRGGLLPLNRVRKGLNDPDDLHAAEEMERLEKDARELRDSLTEEEEDVLRWYQMFGSEWLNAPLLGGKHQEKFERDIASHDEEDRSSTLARIKGYKETIDGIFATTKPADEPRRLHRIHRLPDKNLDEFLSNFEVGKTFTFKGYTSTSVDPDFIVYADVSRKYDSAEERQASRVVFEISSPNGVVLHEPGESDGASWSVQDDEREVLLAPGSKMRVVGIGESVKYQSSRTSQDGSGKPWDQDYHKRGRSSRFTVIQLVDITEGD